MTKLSENGECFLLSESENLSYYDCFLIELSVTVND